MWNGKKSTGIFYYCPTVTGNPTSIALMAVGGDVGVSCFTDEASGVFKNPQELVDLYVQINNEVLA